MASLFIRIKACRFICIEASQVSILSRFTMFKKLFDIVLDGARAGLYYRIVNLTTCMCHRFCHASMKACIDC